MLHSLTNYIPFCHSTKEDENLVQNKKTFETLLRSSETEKTQAFILEHPELINEPLFNSPLNPLELSLSLRKIQNLKTLIQNGAQVNTPNASGISFLDNIILQNNRLFLREVFGSILGDIFYKTQEETDASTIIEFVMPEANRQIKTIQEDIKRYQDLTQLNHFKNALIEMIKSSSELVIQDNAFFSTKEIFDALIYSILTHKNEVVETLHNQFGADILRLQTTDLKNLFHIAAIANNPEIIEKLAEWGLTVSSLSSISSSTLNSLSPFHYAIFHPTLHAFTALLKAKVMLPSPANLAYLKPASKTIKEDIKKFTFNPFQLLVFKANLNDPLPKGSALATAYFLVEAANLIAHHIKPELTLSDEYLGLLGLIRTSFLVSNMTKAITKTNFSTLLTQAGFLAATAIAGATIYSAHAANPILGTIRSFSSYYIPIASVLMIKKAWNDFTSYQNAYLFRPGKTLWTFTKDMFANFLFVKHAFFDPDVDYEKAYKSYMKNRKFTSPGSSHSTGSSHSFNTKEALSELKGQLKALHPQNDIKPCVRGKFLTLGSILSCLSDNSSINMKNISYQWLSNKEQEKLIRGGLLAAVHPDLCARTFSKEKKLQKLCVSIFKKVSGILPNASS